MDSTGYRNFLLTKNDMKIDKVTQLKFSYVCLLLWLVRYSHYPYRQYTNLFIFLFVSEHCLRSTLRLFQSLRVSRTHVQNCSVTIACKPHLLVVQLDSVHATIFPLQLINLVTSRGISGMKLLYFIDLSLYLHACPPLKIHTN